MRFTRQLAGCSKVACLFLVPAVLGCESEPQRYNTHAYLDMEATIPACDDTLTIASDSRALLVNEPEALAKLPIEKVLTQILDVWGDRTTPKELLQRMFDTNNQEWTGAFDDGIHCDSDTNFAHANGPAALCPRSEGALAASDGFFEPGDPDHFYPVAVVNRFDLMPVGATTCGEYRIVYAKRSGLTDPNNRVFLIFEASLRNPKPGSMLACRPVAEFWQSLDAEPNAAAVADRLQAFFLVGLPGFGPAIAASNLGLNSGGGAGYYGTTGQVRVSQHMDEHWGLRQMGLTLWGGGYLRFEPTTVGNNPMPGLFGVGAGLPQDISSEQIAFADDFVSSSLTTLAASRIEHIGMTIPAGYLSGESALGGSALNDYEARALNNGSLRTAISARIAQDGLGADCPPNDTLSIDAVMRRATVQSCAGCHAPTQFLGADRSIGCGLTWPDSLGEFHIDERGTLSPALKEVFLPHRAEVLTTYLQACDEEAMAANIGGPFGSGAQTKGFHARRTIGGSSTH